MVTMFLAVVRAVLLIGLSSGMAWRHEGSANQCEATIRETIHEDRATVVDETPTRLHSTWLSQECEVRAGPEYIIRKYTFFENGTFLLLRHHYAEESCSVATHTVTARGYIKFLDTSNHPAGITETKYRIESVHIIPLNRQVAHKFGHRLNATCSPQPKWRPYVAQLVYEPGPLRRSTTSTWQSPRYNSLQSLLPTKNTHGMDCLESLSIEFNELRLLRVQRRPTSWQSHALGLEDKPRIELLLGNLAPNVHVKWNHRPTFLQPTALLRADTVSGCPVCGSISRGTEYSPPLLHEVASLPALLGGSWVDTGCESIEGGFWRKRRLQIHSGDKLWTGRWDYYVDSKCTLFSYTIAAAGSYVQRPGRQRRHEKQEVSGYDYLEFSGDRSQEFPRYKRAAASLKDTEGDLKIIRRGNAKSEIIEKMKKKPAEWGKLKLTRKMGLRREELSGEINDEKLDLKENVNRQKRSPEDDDYRHLLQNTQPSMADSFAAMLRGNQRYEETTRKPLATALPLGTTELDLHVAESLLIPGDQTISNRCSGQKGRPMTSWPRDCVPRAIWAPSTLGLRARVGVSWAGQYTLLLGRRDDNIWEAPLQQCGQTSTYNPALRAHLRASVGLRYGLYSSTASTYLDSTSIVLRPLLLICLYFLVR